MTHGLHLAVLSAFALAQPLFDLLGREPEFFAARGSQSVDIIAFALAVTLVPPLLLLVPEVLLGLIHPPLMRLLHAAIVGGLVGLIAVQALKSAGEVRSSLLLLAALLIGVGAALAYLRAGPVRSFLTILAPAPLLFLALFLFMSPVAKLTSGSEAEARGANVATDTPIVMLIFDEFPLTSLLNERNQLDVARYPNFGALARKSTWFRNSTTVHDRTTKAVPAILTGMAPRPDALPTASDHPNNLFTLFGSKYELRVSEEATTLCPRNLCRESSREQSFSGRMRSLASDLSLVYLHIALPRAFTARFPSITQTWGDFRGEEGGEGEPGAEAAGAANARYRANRVNRIVKLVHEGRAARFEDFVGAMERGRRPTLDFKHNFFPHVPWQYLPSGQRYLKTYKERIPGLSERVLRDDWVVTQAYQRHMLQVGFTDRLLGTVLRQLREEGLYERALIVVTADHGASFRRNGNRRVVTKANIEDIASVPLLIKAPYQLQGRVNDAYVQTTDILPTMADLLGIRLPWATDGRSAFSSSFPRRRTVELERGPEATIGRGRDERVAVPARLFEARQKAALERQLALFGSGSKDRGLYAVGPNPELLGRRVDELEAPGRARMRAELDRPALFESVDPRSGFVPSQVTGRIVGEGTSRKREIAIALNGRIAAVAETFSIPEGPGERFSAMVPESAFGRGRNVVEVFSVSPGARRRLEPLGRAGGG